eukprot:7386577-Prymnesium_polylepis.1
MPSSTTSPAEILLAAAAAAAESSAFSSAGAGSMRTWRTQKRQPQIRDDGVSEQRCELPYYLQIKAAKRNGDPSHKHKLIRSCDQGYGRSWATREAAAASRQDFKVWVDKGCPGMHLAQQAAKDARDRPKQAGQSSGTPTRFSERAK